MSQSVNINRCFGWVVDPDQRSYGPTVDAVVDELNRDRSWEVLNAILREDMVECEIVPFGYDFHSRALVATDSQAMEFDWVHDLDKFLPNAKEQPAFERELAKAVDALDWHNLELGKPKWMLLVTYG